jgi:response regulator RpfG family c-di-GMP phosphodiesterase/HAMP domain-containing protein
MGLKEKIIVTLILVVFGVLAVVYLSDQKSGEITQGLQILDEEVFPSTIAAVKLEILLKDSENSFLQAIEGNEGFEGELLIIKERFTSLLDSANMDPRPELNATRRDYVQYIDMAINVGHEIIKNPNRIGTGIIALAEQSQKVKKQLNAYEALTRAEYENAQSKIISSARKLKLSGIIGGPVLLLLLMLSAFVNIRAASSVNLLSLSVEKFSNNNFETPIKLTRSDEIGSLQLNIENMRANLKKTMGELAIQNEFLKEENRKREQTEQNLQVLNYRLREIIDLSSEVFRIKTIEEFSERVLKKTASVLSSSSQMFANSNSGFIAIHQDSKHMVIAGLGEYARHVGKPVGEVVNSALLSELMLTEAKDSPVFKKGFFSHKIETHEKTEIIIYLNAVPVPTESEMSIIQIFCSNLSIAVDNLILNNEIISTQKEIVDTLGDVIETRSQEAANHVRRVSEYSHMLAEAIGLSPEEALIIRNASPMHDAGKIGIPDSILNKEGLLTPAEFEIMKTHTQIGYDILRHSRRPMLQAAAIVARDHHEKWDGSGYPAGTKGEAIHIFGRITAVADVFDALSSERCYKKAWPIEEALDYLSAQRGLHFDPLLVDVFQKNLAQVLYIRKTYPDKTS